ncbi:MAG: hypothetical protein HY721_30375 [Planctomycetes bacterium]|nr:hypothetical protein [Planctomycetota bacterium]
MIQFFGVHVDAEAASVVSLGRDLRIWARSSSRVINAVRDPAAWAVEVPVAEWTRAAEHAIQEAYFALPVSARKAWGLGISGPTGWVLLDVEFEPISPLRLTADDGLAADLRRWLDANPRAAKKVSTILSPKDYVRFDLSHGLAADAASASRLGLLREGMTRWSSPSAEALGIPVSWLPPVFDGHLPTGRLSEDGIRRTSLPGGAWLVAGAHETEAAIVAAGDVRDGSLWVIERPGKPALLAYGVQGLGEVSPPGGWRAVRSSMEGCQLLEREIDGEAEVDALRSELERAGFPVRGVSRGHGDAALGAASLAAIGSGLVKGWDRYYRERSLEEPPSE